MGVNGVQSMSGAAPIFLSFGCMQSFLGVRDERNKEKKRREQDMTMAGGCLLKRCFIGGIPQKGDYLKGLDKHLSHN